MYFRNELEITELLERHKKLYEEGNPEIPDRVYDVLEELALEIENKKDDKPLFENWQPKRGKVIRHETPMTSMNRTYDLHGITKKLSQKIKDPSGHLFTVEAKYDGIAFSAKYVDGILHYVATRGNCIDGEDITAFVVYRGILPPHLLYTETVEIRGEFYVDKCDFESFNKTAKKEYSTPQHLANAAVLDSSIKVKVNYVVYRCLGGVFENIDSVIGQYKEARSLGLNTVKYTSVYFSDLEVTVEEFYKAYKDNSKKYGFYTFRAPLDGIVIKFNDIETQNKLGSTVRKPRWSVAYKFPSESKKSVIRDINYQLTMDGEHVPIAVIDPVTIGGRRATSPSLYNHAIMKVCNYAIGKEILVESTGGTVFTIKPLKDSPIVDDAPIPHSCVSCGSPIILNDDKVFCSNPCECRGSKLKRFERFFGRNGVAAKGLGTKRLEEFLSNYGFLEYPEDVYKLFRKGYVIDDKLHTAMNESLSVPLNKILIALCIPNIGEVEALYIQNEVGNVPLTKWLEEYKTTSEPFSKWLNDSNLSRLKHLSSLGFKAV